MPKLLIVNADDYGRAPSVSAGIRQAHLRGIVTSTSAMMNMPGVEAELQTALAECPSLGLGVHLTLTAGSPVLAPKQVFSVASLADGRSFPKLDALVKCSDSLNTVGVKAEWRAQIEKFVRAAGRPPTHLDSHHHTSYLTPALFGAMLELAREHRCAIRAPLAAPTNIGEMFGEVSPEALEQFQQFISALLKGAPNVQHPDYFEVRFYGEQANTNTLREIIARLPEGVTELMCHPGLPDEGLEAITSYNRQRAVELAALTDPGVRAQLREAKVKLISFRELR